jgi:hypothetical protein
VTRLGLVLIVVVAGIGGAIAATAFESRTSDGPPVNGGAPAVAVTVTTTASP